MIGDVQPDFTFRLQAGSSQPPSVAGGGTAANVSVGLARLGVPVAFVGSVGRDPFGDMVVAELAAEGVEVSGAVAIAGVPTPLVFALLPEGGEASLFRWPEDRGADWALRPEHVDLARICSARWLHASGICLRHSPARETILATMAGAKAAGVTVSFDLNFRREQRTDDPALQAAMAEAISHSSIVLGHAEDELTLFAGASSVDQAMQALAGGVRTVVARMGGRGVKVRAASENWGCPAFAIAVVNSVGAGDAFNAGFIAASLGGNDLKTAVRWGQAVAALKLQKGGARALPSRAEVEAFLAMNP